MNKILLKHLEAFLETPVKIRPGYERAEATNEDVEFLDKLIGLLCKAKWQASYDGFVPVDVRIVNRSTHEANHFRPLPYDHEDLENEMFEPMMDIAMMNISLAQEQANRVWRTHQAALNVKRAKANGTYCEKHASYTPNPGKPCRWCAEAKKS